MMDFASIWVIYKLMMIYPYQAQKDRKDQKARRPGARVLTIQIGPGAQSPARTVETIFGTWCLVTLYTSRTLHSDLCRIL